MTRTPSSSICGVAYPLSPSYTFPPPPQSLPPPRDFLHSDYRAATDRQHIRGCLVSPPYLRLRQVASNRHLLFVWFGDLGEGKPQGALRLLHSRFPALSQTCTPAHWHSRSLALSQACFLAVLQPFTLAVLHSRSLALSLTCTVVVLHSR